MNVYIKGEIKLSQFLKIVDLCPTGGMAKFFVKIHKITINGREPEGRNAKVRIGDTVWVDDALYTIHEKM
ncbi:RNA-binding S4 domain-containing protein [[Mycoplasma] falconis]|uniref:RNA-binding S4 domain-containing protein n=1 Tax=[Mycoplasma] falconis TaxID=92403 RepID=A0A501X842_9BACT|nr:RNA-binding S4 domain-containing protein [[Mycoplasma] falconis]TPE56710.1 RNA-binding S4 domain-containing protein [[Mycoplasma] falconis]